VQPISGFGKAQNRLTTVAHLSADVNTQPILQQYTFCWDLDGLLRWYKLRSDGGQIKGKPPGAE